MIAAVNESVSSRSRVFGIPLGELGFFQSLFLATAFACVIFFATCFVAIVSLLIYNEAGHHAVDMADTYLYAAFPAGAVALIVGLLVLLGFWLRRKFSGR